MAHLSPNRFSGKIVLVTGAAQGIGRTVALRAAAEGAALVLVDRAELIHEVAAEIGANALAVTADLETHDGAAEAVAQGIARFGRIDVLLNNVGGTIWMRPYAEYTPPQIEAEIRQVVKNSPRRLILGADCTVEADTSWDRLRQAIAVAHQVGSPA